MKLDLIKFILNFSTLRSFVLNKYLLPVRGLKQPWLILELFRTYATRFCQVASLQFKIQNSGIRISGGLYPKLINSKFLNSSKWSSILISILGLVVLQPMIRGLLNATKPC